MGFLMGVIQTADHMRFKKLIFRITKGNSYFYFEQIQNKPGQAGENDITDFRVTSFTRVSGLC